MKCVAFLALALLLAPFAGIGAQAAGSAKSANERADDEAQVRALQAAQALVAVLPAAMPGLTLDAEYSYQNQGSNLELNTYDRHLLKVGLSKQW